MISSCITVYFSKAFLLGCL